MLHVVPILCLIFFIFFVEYRLKEHINNTDKELKSVAEELALQKGDMIKLRESLNPFIHVDLLHE